MSNLGDTQVARSNPLWWPLFSFTLSWSIGKICSTEGADAQVNVAHKPLFSFTLSCTTEGLRPKSMWPRSDSGRARGTRIVISRDLKQNNESLFLSGIRIVD